MRGGNRGGINGRTKKTVAKRRTSTYDGRGPEVRAYRAVFCRAEQACDARFMNGPVKIIMKDGVRLLTEDNK